MPTPQALSRLDTLIWALIFGGLFLLVLGIASHGETRVGGWSMSVLGALATAAGVVLIGVRARLHPTPAAGAQSDPTKSEKQT